MRDKIAEHVKDTLVRVEFEYRCDNHDNCIHHVIFRATGEEALKYGHLQEKLRKKSPEVDMDSVNYEEWELRDKEEVE